MLVRSWQSPSSRRALEFVGQVVALAERLDHHPETIMVVRPSGLNSRRIADGGLTEEDFALAAEISNT